MSHIRKSLIAITLCFSFFISSLPFQTVSAAKELFPFVLLSQYDAALDIGEEICLLAFTSNAKQPTWKSSNSRIASVNTYGIVTAKKSGSVVITAKITNAEASCYVTVNQTRVVLSKTSAALEHGETLQLSAKTSNQSKVTWKSSKKSIATVSETGLVTGLKPGETVITATADDTSVICTLKVKAPTVQLNKASISLYRGETIRLSATVSSRIAPSWKSNKKSVAVVDANGVITAVKNGSATISATVDGVTATCNITVKKPDITLSSEEIRLKKGTTAKLTATVSSGNLPNFSSSNTNIVTISSYGEIKAKQKGKAYVYASEDGTKARCTVYVTE